MFESEVLAKRKCLLVEDHVSIAKSFVSYSGCYYSEYPEEEEADCKGLHETDTGLDEV